MEYINKNNYKCQLDSGLRIITIILKCDIHNRTDIKEGEVYER